MGLGVATVTERATVVLAGGHSRRFGDEEKALATLHGKPLLQHVVEAVGDVAETVIVSCRESQQEPFEVALEPLSQSVQVKYVHDPVPDQGPLAGLAAALDQTETSFTAVVACDMPAVDPAFLSYLFDRASGSDGAVPTLPDGRIQPTQAVYRTTAMQTAATASLDGGERSLQKAIERLAIEVLSPDTVEAETYWLSLRNVNTPAELAELEAQHW